MKKLLALGLIAACSVSHGAVVTASNFFSGSAFPVIDDAGVALDGSTGNSVLIGSFLGKSSAQVRTAFDSSPSGTDFLAEFTAIGDPVRFATGDVSNLAGFYSGDAIEFLDTGNSLINSDIYTVISSNNDQFLVVNHGAQFGLDPGSSELEQLKVDAFLNNGQELELIVGTFPVGNTVGNGMLDGYQLQAIPEPSTYALMGLGGLMVWFFLRRRRS